MSGNFFHGRYRTRTYDLPHVKRMLIPAELIVQANQAVSRSAMPYYKGSRGSCQALFCGISKKFAFKFGNKWISLLFNHVSAPHKACIGHEISTGAVSAVACGTCNPGGYPAPFRSPPGSEVTLYSFSMHWTLSTCPRSPGSVLQNPYGSVCALSRTAFFFRSIADFGISDTRWSPLVIG